MHYRDKIAHENHLPESLIQGWKTAGNRIVFTNGCFDLLHRGHIQYLSEASALGDKLIVGLNSDGSVSRLKGENRPVKNEVNRSEILASLMQVDMVVIFEGDTPLDLIKKIVPDVLVKGGDWEVEKIVGANFVLERGGAVKSLPFVEGESSTQIINRILSSNK